MLSDEVKIEIRGLEELQREAAQAIAALQGPGLQQKMGEATLMVLRFGRDEAPVRTGRLRASLTPVVRSAGGEVQGIVGTNVVYAPFQEFGTRRMKGRRYLRTALKRAQEPIRRMFRDWMDKLFQKGQ